MKIFPFKVTSLLKKFVNKEYKGEKLEKLEEDA
jgi:hypothetical protein